MPLAHTSPPRLAQPCGRTGAAAISLGLHALALVVLAGVWHVDKPAAPPPAAISARLVLAPQPTAAATSEPLPPAAQAPVPPPAVPRTPVRRTATPAQPPATVAPQASATQAVAPQPSATQNAEAASVATESAPSSPTSAATSDQAQGVATAQPGDTASAASRPHLPIAKQTPDYPQRALDTELEGDCTLEYAVTPDGRTENPHVVGDCHPLFIRPSLQAARGFRYEPRIVDGKAVTVPAVRNTFHFRIER